jgi:hypothetical protein
VRAQIATGRNCARQAMAIIRAKKAFEPVNLLLASAGAGFITGPQVTIDGGMTRKMIYAH